MLLGKQVSLFIVFKTGRIIIIIRVIKCATFYAFSTNFLHLHDSLDLASKDDILK